MKKNANVSEKKNDQIVKINLDKFKDQLSGIELKEKKIRETIYVYPEGFDKEKINSDAGKKFRNSLRNSMKRFCNNILIFAKSDQLEKLQSEIESFKSFYKKNYRINDYSLGSISSSNDPIKERDLNLMIQIIKEIN